MTPIVDTGPLVALLDRSDHHHRWAAEVFSKLHGPLLSCEAVAAEVIFLCTRNRVGLKALYGLLQTGTLRIAPALADSPGPIARLLEKYSSVPMSLADACVVSLHDTVARSVVLTCDSDFRIYRRSGNRAIDALVPDGV